MSCKINTSTPIEIIQWYTLNVIIYCTSTLEKAGVVTTRVSEGGGGVRASTYILNYLNSSRRKF